MTPVDSSRMGNSGEAGSKGFRQLWTSPGARKEAWYLVGFGVTGVCSFLVYAAAMWLMTSVLHTGQVAGSLIGFVLGTTVSYFGNSLWVFRTAPTSSTATKFWVVTAVGFVINISLAFVLERLSFQPLVTVVVIFVTVPMLNYIGHRFWTFRRHAPRAGTEI